MKEKINVKDYAQKITDALPHGGVLLNTNGDKFTAMVIGWGALGSCWGVPTFTVYVRCGKGHHIAASHRRSDRLPFFA